MNKYNVLPTGDRTPNDFCISKRSLFEVIKIPIRTFIYPILNKIISIFVIKKYFKNYSFKPDLCLISQRGNDYETHRKRINSFISLNKSKILVAGCGTASDIYSWYKYEPDEILCIDWFNYEKAWSLWGEKYNSKPDSKIVKFVQGDISNINYIENEYFDVIGSDAVFEHVADLNSVVLEFYRTLKKGGILYATFGPLWYGWGGDHLSGYDSIYNGYNHLLLEEDDYLEYIEKIGTFSHNENDGRTWLKNNMFSYLKQTEYIKILENNGFKKEFISVILDKRALKCLSDYKLKSKLLEKYDLNDLIVCGMTIIYRK
jgi:ubiquinone/menaquinone biosynthesis C-methylase UbiE